MRLGPVTRFEFTPAGATEPIDLLPYVGPHLRTSSPMERPTWSRPNCTTGPKTKPRAPRRIDARGSR
jgi:hypothetical protein